MLQAPTGVKPHGERVKLSLIMIKNDERNEIVWGKNSLGKFEFYFFTQVTHVSSQTITRRDWRSVVWSLCSNRNYRTEKAFSESRRLCQMAKGAEQETRRASLQSK